MAWLPSSREPATLPYQSHPGHPHSLPSSKENEILTEVRHSTRTKLVTPVCRILFQGCVSSCFGFIRHVFSSKDSKEWHERLLVHILYPLVMEPSAMKHRQHPFNCYVQAMSSYMLEQPALWQSANSLLQRTSLLSISELEFVQVWQITAEP